MVSLRLLEATLVFYCATTLCFGMLSWAWRMRLAHGSPLQHCFSKLMILGVGDQSWQLTAMNCFIIETSYSQFHSLWY